MLRIKSGKMVMVQMVVILKSPLALYKARKVKFKCKQRRCNKWLAC